MHLSFVAAMFVATVFAARFPRARWIVPALAVLVLLNAASHLPVGLSVPSAASGTISSMFIWLPLGAFALARAAQHLRRREFWGGTSVGLLVQLFVTWLAALG